VNCGSSSLKYQLFEESDKDNPQLLSKGIVERIGKKKSNAYMESSRGKYIANKQIKSHSEAIKLVTEFFTDPEKGVLKNIQDINAVGHRVVHGGEGFSKSIIIDEGVIRGIEKYSELAPLHNPANLTGIRACIELLPKSPQVAVFDTAFHQTIPEFAWLYGLPYDYYQKYKIRRYGFHGTSHKYVSLKAAQFLGRPLGEMNLITCHLGNGCSITAVKKGQSFDTSMGFTPLEGVIMGTRTGDLDPAIIFFLMEKEHLSYHEINDILNKKSGLLGVSGVSNDMRDIEEAANQGNKHARLALLMFAYHIKKYIGAYAAAMGHMDVIVFTGGIGEHHVLSRKNICQNLSSLGVFLDHEKNAECCGKIGCISKDDSPVKVLVIPTNEEVMIAKETFIAVTAKQKTEKHRKE
jgi:acetate kinase